MQHVTHGMFALSTPNLGASNFRRGYGNGGSQLISSSSSSLLCTFFEKTKYLDCSCYREDRAHAWRNGGFAPTLFQERLL